MRPCDPLQACNRSGFRLFIFVTSAPDDTGYSASARSRLHRVLVDELREAHERTLHLPEPRDDRLQAIARMLQETPADNATLAELGKRIGAGSRTLSRLFHDELGMTFYEWRTQVRIYNALVLLAEGHDATHTSNACGWANPSSFIAAFSNVIGTTPGRYRGRRAIPHASPPPTVVTSPGCGHRGHVTITSESRRRHVDRVSPQA